MKTSPVKSIIAAAGLLLLPFRVANLKTYGVLRKYILYRYTAKRRDLLGFKSLTTKIFPKAR